MSGLEDSENSNSVNSQTTGSPYSSPAQLVPGIESTRDRYFDNISMHSAEKSGESRAPYLDIIIQPEQQFRFRYYSEKGTHGCLQGKSKDLKNTKKKRKNSRKTFPTVELKNYTGKAVIKCQLYQFDKEEEHPHKLLEDENHIPSVVVPDGKSYTVCFEGLGVMFRSKKSIPDLIYAKKVKELKKAKKKNLEEECKEIAKNINVNIVRLRFSAHDVKTDEEICHVYSDPVYNNKNADTNELKIVRSSQYCGSACGGYDVILLVEKISKKNVRVNVFDKGIEKGKGWMRSIELVDSYIHHQYAIVIPMPPYKDGQITESVDVYIELQREIDERISTSNAIEFKYTPQPFNKIRKRRKLGSSFSDVAKDRIISQQSSISISEGQPIENVLQHDVTMATTLPTQTTLMDIPAGSIVGDYYVQPHPTPMYTDSNYDMIDNKMYLRDGSDPMLSQVNGVKLQAPFQQSHNVINSMSLIDDLEQFGSTLDIEEFFRVTADSFKIDSGRACSKMTTNIQKEIPLKYTSEEREEIKKLIKEIIEMKKSKSDFRGIIKEKMDRLFEIRLPNGDTFLAMTLTNNVTTFKFIVNTVAYVGANYLLNSSNDLLQTVLHLAILHNMPDMVTFLIDKDFQTPLLLAIARDYGDEAIVLLEQGTDPCEGTEYTSTGVTCSDSQDLITETPTTTAFINTFGVKPCIDINVASTSRSIGPPVHRELKPLHMVLANQTKHLDTRKERPKSSAFVKDMSARLACITSRPQGVFKKKMPLYYEAKANETHLLSEKTSSKPARPALHAAIQSASLPMIKLLLDFTSKDNIDMTDWKGLTALQIACGGPLREHTLDVIRILLEKGANPMCHTKDNKPAWKLARRHQDMWEMVREYVTADVDGNDECDECQSDSSDNDECQSDSSYTDDDFHSADEGESTSTDCDISLDMECLKIGEPIAVRT